MGLGSKGNRYIMCFCFFTRNAVSDHSSNQRQQGRRWCKTMWRKAMWRKAMWRKAMSAKTQCGARPCVVQSSSDRSLTHWRRRWRRRQGRTVGPSNTRR